MRVNALLRDVLEIPERAGTEDYVLRLTDSVGSAAVQATLDEYVVTPSLKEAFDTALGLVADAVSSGISRGAFLAGSFGSGKSHFMAVLHALLRHEPTARAKAELQDIVARHDGVLLDRKVLPLAFHLLGASTMEQALFDGYLRQIQALHPGAPLPALHQSDGILADAERQRQRDGDERFFAVLNEGLDDGADGGDVWGAVLGGATWTPQKYHAARAAAPGNPARQELVTRLAETYFTSYTRQASYVDLDTGLAAISSHAKSLGYDAVVLFLDELVLWLAFSVQDPAFFRRESQKITKLVESATGVREIPLVSFIARQMDLRRWFADAGASGAEQEALEQAFRYQEGRFATVPLGDENLPYVANRRLLRRKDGAAEQVIDDAFGRLDRRAEVWDVLLDGVNTDEQHRGADEAAFRLTYPFSPALVSTLRSLASAMQRERTALKVMQQMLVDRRDSLTVDEVVPVGDCFEYVVEGREPLDAQLAGLFRSATALYREKLRPLILAKNDLTEADLPADPAAQPAGFRAEDRLAKTLLLSAVATKVPALRELTAARLASLNHGSIVSPLPGAEVSVVLSKVREWAGKIPEIHVGSDPRNPVIRVQLSDVDYESVVERAKGEDNDGRRRELIRDLVRDAIGLVGQEPDLLGAFAHQHTWRGSRRDVDVVFGNVRDAGWLSEDHFRAKPNSWRVVVDHPFDDPGHSTAEDIARLELMGDRGFQDRTIVWLPRFLSEERMRDVRRLVILDWLLSGSGERWTTHADHLSEVDRVQARAILETHRTALREGLRRAVQEAYGAAAPTVGTLVDDAAHDRILVSMTSSFQPAAPVGADLAAAFRNLLDQAWQSTYPAHPQFEPPDVAITVKDLSAVYSHVERAVADPDGRVPLDRDVATAVRRVANALGVGTAGETHFLFGDDRFLRWGSEFERAMTRAQLQPHDPVTVDQVRGWIRAIEPKVGLREEVADLVVLAWAALRQRSWYHHGVSVPTPRPGALRPEMEARTEPMPAAEDWALACARVQGLVGLVAPQHMTATAVARLAEDVRAFARTHADSARALVTALEESYRTLGLPTDGDSGRLGTARATARLLAALQGATERVALIETFARTALPTDASAAKSITTSSDVTTSLRSYQWDRLAPLRAAASESPSDVTATNILAGLRDALADEEFVSPLRPALRSAGDAIFGWLTERAGTGTRQPEPATETRVVTSAGDVEIIVPVRASGKRSRIKGAPADEVLHELSAFLDAHPDDTVVVEWRVE